MILESSVISGASVSLLKLSQYIWIGSSILAALVIVPTVQPVSLLVLSAALCILPAVASLWVITSKRRQPMGEAFMLFGWTLLATAAVSATGGARSPAIILFAIGPLTAYVIGNSRLALECTIFSAIAYLGAAALGSFNVVAELGEPRATLGGAAAAMGITQTLILLLTAYKNRDDQESLPPRPVAATPAETAPHPAVQPPNDSAEKLLKERNAYFASLSHDLRSPFTAILGYAEAFKMNLKGNLTEKQVDQASIIHESAEDLLSLVDDMMDLAKSEAGKLTIDPEPIHLGDLGESIMHQMQAMADRKNITMQFDVYGDPWAMADARLVRRIWQNLISNAIKYSDHDSLIQLAASERARHAVLSVKDHGRGMSEDDLRRIAEPFTMGDNSREKSGTGLGLVNVKRFADMHGGKVVIDTAPSKGARFQVTLPKADAETFEPL